MVVGVVEGVRMSIGKTLNNTLEKERRLCYGEDERSGNARKFKEGIEEVFKRIGFRVDKAGRQGFKGGWKEELVLNTSRLILQPIWMLKNATKENKRYRENSPRQNGFQSTDLEIRIVQ